MLYNKPIDVNNRVKEIIKIVQKGQKLDYITKTFLQKRLIGECERLYQLLFVIPESLQEDVKEWIKKIQATIEVLEQREAPSSLFDNLATRLDTVGKTVKEM